MVENSLFHILFFPDLGVSKAEKDSVVKKAILVGKREGGGRKCVMYMASE